jgi:hypothetical protein
MRLATGTSHGVVAALRAMATSSSPYMRSGFETRFAIFPSSALPIPKPAMKMPKTAAADAVVAPKISRSSRIHAIWKTSAAQPDASTKSETTATRGCESPIGVPGAMPSVLRAGAATANLLPVEFRYFLLRFFSMASFRSHQVQAAKLAWFLHSPPIPHILAAARPKYYC